MLLKRVGFVMRKIQERCSHQEKEFDTVDQFQGSDYFQVQLKIAWDMLFAVVSSS